MSSSESEDDFESASEGDDSSSYDEDVSDDNDASENNENQLQVPSTSAIPVDQTKEVKLAPSVDNNVDPSSLVENVVTQDEKEVVQMLLMAPPVLTTEEIPSINTLQPKNVEVQDKATIALPSLSNSSEKSSTCTSQAANIENSPNNAQQEPKPELQTVVLAKTLEGVAINTKDQKREDKKSHEIQEPIQFSSFTEDAVPSDIVNKISTRSVSSRARPNSNSKPKPTLGAKKLGGVKLSLPLENTSLDRDKEESFFSNKVENVFVSHQTQEMNLSSVVNQKKDGGGWGGWFAPPKLLSSVTSFTTQILSTVENGLNIPEPEDLAKEDLLLDAQGNAKEVDAARPPKEENQEEKTAGFSQLIGGVSNITRFVESTGSSLFSTGLGTLEAIGKKTIDVLQQSDPGLKRTKAVLANPLQVNQDRPCLSQILREAKETNEFDSKQHDAGAQRKQNPITESLTTLFEHYQGLVHMEALEILSNQCQSRVAPQIRRLTAQRRTAVEEIVQLCSRVSESDDSCDPDEFDLDAMEQNLTSYFDSIGLQMSVKKLMDGFRRGFGLDTTDVSSPESCYSGALHSLALVTSLAVELLHKSSELLLTTPKSSNPAISGRLEAETFNKIVVLLEGEITRLGGHHANQIILAEHGEKGQYSTDIYYEASNCSVYVQNAYKQMIPILQSRFF